MFNKLWAETTFVESFYPSFWSIATFLSKYIWPVYSCLCKRHLSFLFLLFYRSPSTHWDPWISCCWSTCPRLLSGTNFKKLGKKDRRGKIWLEREKESGSSGTTEPLQLFKWPLSLCTCSLCLVWILKWLPPKKTDLQKMKLMQRAKAGCAWLFTSLPEQLLSSLCYWQRDFEE